MENTMANSIVHFPFICQWVKAIVVLVVLIFSGTAASAQLTREQRKLLSEANVAYREGRFSDTDSLIRAAQNLGSSEVASFNGGNSAFRQDAHNEAVKMYQSAEQLASTPEERSRAAYNRGNALMKQNKTAEAIEAYKEALRKNPYDDDARHNLAFAMEQIKQEQEQDQKNKDQQEQEQQEKENEQQEQNENGKDKDEPQDQQGQEQQEQGQEQQQEQGQGQEMKPGQISKEDAERMLDELNRKERALMQQLRNKKNDSKSKNIEKDW
jgi:tetratricopeptide (TPR) repeat protein